VFAVVLLVALGLTIDGLAARNNALIALMWARAVLPGLVCGIILFPPSLWLGSNSGRAPSAPGGSGNPSVETATA
jgi:hypothetical protein